MSECASHYKMARKKIGTRNDNEWTEGKFNSFVRNLLRAGSLRWPPRYKALKKAYVKDGVNPKTNRKCKLHRCSRCSELSPANKMVVDHVIPVVDPLVGFVNWDVFIQRLFCESDNLQALCKKCHSKKTLSESKIASGVVVPNRVRRKK